MAKAVEYELLSKEIFQAILNQSDVNNIDVKHNVVLQGKTTSHQIDIYWEFKLNGIVYKTIVQVKNWNKRVTKGELLLFKHILDDLPGQPKGIFITKSGYQKGATQVAKANGIDLLELEEIKNEPLKITVYGYAKAHLILKPIVNLDTNSKSIAFIMEADIYETKFTNRSIMFDINWLMEKLELSETEVRLKFSTFATPLTQPQEFKFYDNNESIVTDLHSIYHGFANKIRKDKVNALEITHTFTNPTFIKIPNHEIAYVKVISFTTLVTQEKSNVINMHLSLPDIVQFILRNLHDGTERFFGKKKL